MIRYLQNSAIKMDRPVKLRQTHPARTYSSIHSFFVLKTCNQHIYLIFFFWEIFLKKKYGTTA